MSEIAIPFSRMTRSQILAVYNELALERDLKPIKHWRGPLCDLVEKTAILRATSLPNAREIKQTKRPIARKKRSAPTRMVAIRALLAVSHFEVTATGERISRQKARHIPMSTLTPIGLSYVAAAARVRKLCPHSRLNADGMRFIAHMIRIGAKGYETTRPLPPKRLRGKQL